MMEVSMKAAAQNKQRPMRQANKKVSHLEEVGVNWCVWPTVLYLNFCCIEGWATRLFLF